MDGNRGEELHQGVRGSWKGCLVAVSVHPAIMSAGPYLHSIAFSMQVHLASGDFAQSTKSSESIVRLPNPLLKPNESSDPFY